MGDYEHPFSRRDPAIWPSLDADAKADALDEAMTALWEQLASTRTMLQQNEGGIRDLTDMVTQAEIAVDDLSKRVAGLGR
jgi:hypothetical protein